MWNKIKSFFLIGVFFFSFLLLENQNTLGIIKAADLQKNTNASEELNIQIIAYDAETDMGLAVISTGNATVIGDGVRLRSQPSTSGAILEKMYRGEYVWVKLQSNGWCYLQRLKTGTLGWASADYIRVL
ncbi:SH3 domain-containing protein [Lachnospiraceae bacterium 29-84]